jgi:coenzyme F420-0:L-glutamate ligase / coenzyme F420-1:gamma-L-glutamate ligase
VSTGVQLLAVDGLPEVVAGTDLAALITRGVDLQDGDIVVVASKVVAKAEGAVEHPHQGEALAEARQRLTLQDEVLVEAPWVTVVRTAHGFVCANAGIDASNVGQDGGGALLRLPADPDASAAAIRRDLASVADVGVVISDTFGRAWREGQTDVALGVAGLAALRDERGSVDRDGRVLRVTLVAVADQLAGAADLLRDKASGVPVVVVRGLGHLLDGSAGGGAALVRDPATDLFPHGRGWLARRLATGEGVPVRTGAPADWEWQLVRRAAATGGADVALAGGALVTTDGRAAGRAESCLLDLGYGVEVDDEATVDGRRYVVTVA